MTTLLSRRAALAGLFVAAAPLVVRTPGLLMPVKALRTPLGSMAHVAVNGCDTTGDGSASRPFATISRAVHAFRGAVMTDMHVEVCGTYVVPRAGPLVRVYSGESLRLSGPADGAVVFEQPAPLRDFLQTTRLCGDDMARTWDEKREYARRDEQRRRAKLSIQRKFWEGHAMSRATC